MIDLSFAVRVVIGVLGLAIVVTGFCRARLMTASTTRPLIRFAMTAMAAGGFVLILAAIAPTPKLATTALIWVPSSALFAQAAAAYYWRPDVPAAFQKPLAFPPIESTSADDRRAA